MEIKSILLCNFKSLDKEDAPNILKGVLDFYLLKINEKVKLKKCTK